MHLNKTIMNSILDEIDRTISRAGKSHDEVITILLSLHPEITFSPDDWNQLSSEAQTGIITRIRKTLESFS